MTKPPSKNPPLPETVSAPADAITADFDVKEIQKEQDKLSSPASDPITASTPAPISATSTSEPTPALAIAAPATVISQASPPRSLAKKWIVIGSIVLFLILVGIGIYALIQANGLVKVQFHSSPSGAEITLDGKKIGTTPLTIRIGKGAHQVIFEQSGYQTIQKNLMIQDGRVIVKKMLPIVLTTP